MITDKEIKANQYIENAAFYARLFKRRTNENRQKLHEEFKGYIEKLDLEPDSYTYFIHRLAKVTGV